MNYWILITGDFILFILCLIASIYDIKKRIIPDSVSIASIIIGFLIQFLLHGWTGILFTILMVIIGGGIFFLMSLKGGMGGGDVKMISGVTAILGYPLAFWSWIYIALIGGLIAIITIIIKGQTKKIFMNIFRLFFFWNKNKTNNELKNNEKIYIPYAVAIFIGVFFAILGRYFPMFLIFR